MQALKTFVRQRLLLSHGASGDSGSVARARTEAVPNQCSSATPTADATSVLTPPDEALAETSQPREWECCLCGAVFNTQLFFTVPTDLSPGTECESVETDQASDRMCHRCFGRCYRTLVVPKLAQALVRGPLDSSGGSSDLADAAQRTGAVSAPVTERTLGASGKTMAAVLRQFESSVATAYISSASLCARCRTRCVAQRASQNGLLPSVCIDGQPHVLWRCQYCWHQHTLDGLRCEACGCGNGAHVWQCPFCFMVGEDGSAESVCRSGRATGTAANSASARLTPRTALLPRRTCGACHRVLRYVIHETGSQSRAPRLCLQPVEEELQRRFQTEGYTVAASPAPLEEPDVAASPPAVTESDNANDMFTVLAAQFLGDAGQAAVLRHLCVHLILRQARACEPYFLLFVLNRGVLWHSLPSCDAVRVAMRRVAKADRAPLRARARALQRSYLRGILLRHNSGDELCLQVLANYFGVVIHLLTPKPNRWHVVFAGSEDGEPVFRPCCVRQYVPFPKDAQRTDRRAVTVSSALAEDGGSAVVPHEPPAPAAQSTAHAAGGKQKKQFVVLLDERLSAPGTRASHAPMGGERVHLFLRRDGTTGPYTCYEANGRPLARSAELLNALLVEGFQHLEAEVRTEELVRQRLEYRPAVPLRAPQKVVASPVTPVGVAPPVGSPVARGRETPPVPPRSPNLASTPTPSGTVSLPPQPRRPPRSRPTPLMTVAAAATNGGAALAPSAYDMRSPNAESVRSPPMAPPRSPPPALARPPGGLCVSPPVIPARCSPTSPPGIPMRVSPSSPPAVPARAPPRTPSAPPLAERARRDQTTMLRSPPPQRPPPMRRTTTVS